MLGKVSIAFKTFGVCDFSRLAVTDWRLRRWRLWFLALMIATRIGNKPRNQVKNLLRITFPITQEFRDLCDDQTAYATT